MSESPDPIMHTLVFRAQLRPGIDPRWVQDKLAGHVNTIKGVRLLDPGSVLPEAPETLVLRPIATPEPRLNACLQAVDESLSHARHQLGIAVRAFHQDLRESMTLIEFQEQMKRLKHQLDVAQAAVTEVHDFAVMFNRVANLQWENAKARKAEAQP